MISFASDPIARVTRAEATSRRSLGRSVVVAFVAVVAVLGLCQLLLPTIATRRLGDALATNASGVHVSIHAFPAAELLFDRADSVDVRIDRLRISKGGGGSLHRLLERIGRTEELNASVGTMWSHGLELRHVVLRKRGATVTLRASVTDAAIRRALPSYLRVTGTPKTGGGMSLSLTAALLGRSVTARAAVVARAGDVEVSPELPLLEGLGLKLFSDPHVVADSVSMTATADRYALEATGHYR